MSDASQPQANSAQASSAQASSAQASSAQAGAVQRRPRRSRSVTLPGEDLSLEETLRVMDVAREMRQRRQTAEEMFRRDDLRIQLREKLLRAAQVTGDDVTAAELDAAIEQYLETLHAYQDPPPSWKRFAAHAWVWRGRILASATALAAAAGAFWLLFF